MISKSTAEAMQPIRIGGQVPKGSLVCVGCGDDCQRMPAHVQPRLRFTMIAWVPVLTEEHAKVHDFPYFGSPTDPPLEVDVVRADPAANEENQYVRYLGWS